MNASVVTETIKPEKIKPYSSSPVNYEDYLKLNLNKHLQILKKIQLTAPALDYLEELPNEAAYANAERFVNFLAKRNWLNGQIDVAVASGGGYILYWANELGKWTLDAFNSGDCCASWRSSSGKLVFWDGPLDSVCKGFDNITQRAKNEHQSLQSIGSS